MKKFLYLSILILLTVLTACNTGSNKDRIILTNITGEPNDVLIVMNEMSWKNGSGKALKKCLEEPYYGLPQVEPSFKTIQIERVGFTNIFQIYRNIVDVHISSKIKKSRIWYGNDVYARPQAFLKIEAKNGLEFTQLIERNKSKILAFFKDAEVERLQIAYKNRFSEKIMKHLRKKFDIRVDIPANYKLETDSNHFSWISYETPDLSQGIFVYDYAYNDTSQFNKENLLAKRDEMLKRFVDGPTKGSYMQTEHRFPARRTVKEDENNFYSVYLEGIWRVEGDFMGGPFVSYSFPDKENGRIICVDAYVYCPKKEKRDFAMQMESIIKTARYNQ